MSKCTKIFENLYLNLKQIVTFEVIADDQLHIITSAPHDSEASDMLITFSPDLDIKLGKPTAGFIYVELQELHRIKREISKYMGIKELKLTQKVDAA